MAQLSETVELIVKSDCDNPVYLRWKHTLGGWGYYLFSKRQLKNIVGERVGTYSIPIFNLATATATEEIYQASVNDSWTLVANNIELYEFELLRTIPESPKIELYTGDLVTHTWLSVKLTGFTLQLDNNKTRHNAQLTIELPNRQTLTN